MKMIRLGTMAQVTPGYTHGGGITTGTVQWYYI